MRKCFNIPCHCINMMPLVEVKRHDILQNRCRKPKVGVSAASSNAEPGPSGAQRTREMMMMPQAEVTVFKLKCCLPGSPNGVCDTLPMLLSVALNTIKKDKCQGYNARAVESRASERHIYGRFSRASAGVGHRRQWAP
jgi:hypothetical protein